MVVQLILYGKKLNLMQRLIAGLCIIAHKGKYLLEHSRYQHAGNSFIQIKF